MQTKCDDADGGTSNFWDQSLFVCLNKSACNFLKTIQNCGYFIKYNQISIQLSLPWAIYHSVCFPFRVPMDLDMNFLNYFLSKKEFYRFLCLQLAWKKGNVSIFIGGIHQKWYQLPFFFIWGFFFCKLQQIETKTSTNFLLLCFWLFFYILISLIGIGPVMVRKPFPLISSVCSTSMFMETLHG